MAKCVHFPNLTPFSAVMFSQVKDLLVSEEFKPNCAMVVLDFLIRHAIIEPDSGLLYTGESPSRI